MDEDTFREALFGEGLREFNGIRKAAGLETVLPRLVVAETNHKPSADNESREEPSGSYSGRLGDNDRNATLFRLAHHLWYQKGIRDRDVIAAKLLERNRQPYPGANHDEPLAEDRVREIAESVGQVNGVKTDDGYRRMQSARGVASGQARREKGNTEIKRMRAEAYRKEGLTQMEIGEKLRISQQYVSTLLDGMPRGVNTASSQHNTCSTSSVVSTEEAFTHSVPSDAEKRRKRVKTQLARKLTKTRMAELCGVTRQTIYDDIKWLEENPDAFRKSNPSKTKRPRRTARERRIEGLMPVWRETHAAFVYDIEVQLSKQEAARRRKQRKKDAWITELPDRVRAYFNNAAMLHSEPTGGQIDTMTRNSAEAENAALMAEIRDGLDDGWNTQWKWDWTPEEMERIATEVSEALYRHDRQCVRDACPPSETFSRQMGTPTNLGGGIAS